MNSNNFNNPWGNNGCGAFLYEDDATPQNEYSGFGGTLKAMGEISSSVAPVLKFIPDLMNSIARLKEAGRHEDTVRYHSEGQRQLMSAIQCQEDRQQQIVEILYHQQQEITQLKQAVQQVVLQPFTLPEPQSLLALPAPTDEVLQIPPGVEDETVASDDAIPSEKEKTRPPKRRSK